MQKHACLLLVIFSKDIWSHRQGSYAHKHAELNVKSWL